MHQRAPNVGLSGKQIDALPVVRFAPFPPSPSGHCLYCGELSCPHSTHADPTTAPPCATPPDGPPPAIFTRSRSCSGVTEALDIAGLQRPHGGSFRPALSAIAGSLASAAPSDSLASTHILGSTRRAASSSALRAAAVPMTPLRGAGSGLTSARAGTRSALAEEAAEPQTSGLVWPEAAGPVVPGAAAGASPEWHCTVRPPGRESFGMHSSAEQSSVSGSHGVNASAASVGGGSRGGLSLRPGRSRRRYGTFDTFVEDSEAVDVPLLPAEGLESTSCTDAQPSGTAGPPTVIGFEAHTCGADASTVGAIASRSGPGPDASPFAGSSPCSAGPPRSS